MKVLVMIWLLAATFTVLGIAIDMRRLRAHRVWLPLRGWVVACACAGTFSALPYLFMRQRVRRKLIAAAWVLIGGQSQPPEIRRKRLLALKQSGLLGEVVFRVCLASLDVQRRSTLS
ncbi:MAG: hypothetical protein V4793_25920 [Paraburkholderia tropica]|uniref:hypothetical protein n=1 Tax=Paraburkholderia tropica TaxID=92647 RepID=UPI001F2009EC|nr:hypothetical protein [Paraburkholderia tropica]MDE1142910.1 hypothetical protein [Paraburkholderia tropica]